mgnify:CR=1 FL=1
MGITRRQLIQTSVAGAAVTALPQWARAQSTVLNTYNWGTPEEGAAYAKAFTRFADTHPGVTVNDNLIPLTTWSDYADGLVTQIAGGNVPDIINIAIEGVQLAVKKGLLEPLDDYIAASPKAQELLAKIPQQLKDALTVDGKLYEIPNGWQTMVIYYNKEVFDAAGVAYPADGWTWEDFLATSKALTSVEGDKKVFGYGMPWFNFAHYPWFLTNGSYPISDDGTASNMTDPKMIEAAQFLHDMVHVHKVSPDPIGLNVFDQFANGSLAMISAGRWPVPGWVESGFTGFDIAPWPQKETGKTVFGCAGWGISPASKNKQDAFEALLELIDLETVTEIMNFGQQIPIYREAATSENFLAMPENAKLFFGVIEQTRPVAAPPYFSQLDRILARAMDNVITQAETPEVAFTKADRELKRAIRRG